MLRVVADARTSAELRSILDEIVGGRARRMLVAVWRPEVTRMSQGWLKYPDENGKRLVVRNGDDESRQAAGPVPGRSR